MSATAATAAPAGPAVADVTPIIRTQGLGKVYSAGTGGRELVYEVVGPGALLGELSLDGGPRSASVKALTDVSFTTRSATGAVLASGPMD